MTAAGLLLAAGAGTRYGLPKGLVAGPDGRAWVFERHRALVVGGCDPVLVVVGAAGEEVAALLPPEAAVVRAAAWQEGMGASLRAGLAALAALHAVPDAALVALVDTPGVGPEVVARLVEQASPSALAQAAYGGAPGHPVLLGRDHWDGVARVAFGDRGARGYLRARAVRLVDCTDVGSGDDVDTPPDPPRPTPR